MAQARTNFKCFRCSQIVVGNYSSLTKHLRHVHAMKTSSTSQAHLVCAQNSCSEVFTNFSDFNYHLRFCKLFESSHAASGASTKSHCFHDPLSRSSEFDSGSLTSESFSFLSVSTSKVVETKDFLAQVMLELKAKHNVSNAALDFLTDKLREGFSELGTNEEGKQNSIESGPPQKRLKVDSSFHDAIDILGSLNSKKRGLHIL